MAYPVVAATNTTADTDGTSTVINMPASISAGDLLIVWDANDATGTPRSQSGGSDWTRISTGANGTTVSMAIFAKIAAGGDTLTLAGAAQDSATVSVRITGHGVTNVRVDIIIGTPATGTDAAPDPPTVTHGGPQDYLVIEGFSADDDTETATYWSTNYSAVNWAQSANSTSSCMVALGQRSVNGTSENPGKMALGGAEAWVAQTLSIPPVLPTFYQKYSDAFTRADNTDLGSEWDAGYTGRDPINLVSNSVRATTLNVNAVESQNVYSAPADQWCQFTLGTWSGAVNSGLTLIYRAAAPSTVTWMECVIHITTTETRISERVAGARTGLATESTTTYATNDVIRCFSIGTRHVIQKNQVSVLVGVGSGVTSGSRSGLDIFVATGGSLANVTVLDFQAGDFVAPGKINPTIIQTAVHRSFSW